MGMPRRLLALCVFLATFHAIPMLPFTIAVSAASVVFDTVGGSLGHVDGEVELPYVGSSPTPVNGEVVAPCSIRARCNGMPLGSYLTFYVGEIEEGTTYYLDPPYGDHSEPSAGVTAVKLVFHSVQLDTVDRSGEHIAGEVALHGAYALAEGPWETPCQWVQDRPWDGWTTLQSTCAAQGPDGIALWVGIDAIQEGKTLYVDPRRGNYYVDSGEVTAITFVFYTVQLDTVDRSGEHIAGEVALHGAYALAEGPWETPCQWVQDRPCDGWTTLQAKCDAQGPDGIALWVGLGAIQQGKTLYVDPREGNRYVDSGEVTAIKFVFCLDTVLLDTVDGSGNHIDGQVLLPAIAWVPAPATWWVNGAHDLSATYDTSYLYMAFASIREGYTYYVDPLYGDRSVPTPGVTAVKFVFRPVLLQTVDGSGNHIDGQVLLPAIAWVPAPATWWVNGGYNGAYECSGTHDTSTLYVAFASIREGYTYYVDPLYGDRSVPTPGVTAVKFVFGELQGDVAGPTTTLDLQGEMGTSSWFIGDVTVTITSTDAPDAGFSGVAAIHHTLDGGVEQVVPVEPPTRTASTSFVVAVEGIHTVEAWAVDAAGNVGARATVQPPVDASPPATSVTPNGDQATLDAQDAGSGIHYILYTIDGGPEQQCQPGTIIAIPEGDHELIVWSVDHAGNVGNRVVVVFRIDKTAPVLHLPAPVFEEQAGPEGTAVTFTVTATDNLDPEPVVTCVPASGSVFPAGVTAVDCAATDAAGNTTTGSFSVTVADTTAPSLKLTVLQASLWPPNHRLEYAAEVGCVSDTCDPAPAVSISVSCSEPSDPTDWEVIQNGGVWEVWLRAERAGRGSGRDYYVDVVVLDASGNQTTGRATVTVAHDQRGR